jgi:nucleoside-diphosphate-sugar epimerase
LPGRRVFLTGGTGYLGTRLAKRLLARGHGVRALVRAGSERKVPPGVEVVPGDALDARTYADRIAPCDTFVHLVGVAHPSPAKAAAFRDIDLAGIREAAPAAAAARVAHFVYVSVAQPAPVMQAYVAVRAEGERLVRETGLAATFMRPFYVLGPGHRWPYLLLPLYWAAGLFPASRETARRIGLVTLAQMLDALVAAVEEPPSGIRVVDVPAIRAAGRRAL